MRDAAVGRPLTRSEIMSRIRSTNTRPERDVADLLSASGLPDCQRQLHVPGRPDFGWTGAKVALFVNGCFWHGHNCREHKLPTDFWRAKIRRNVERDAEVRASLKRLGWVSFDIWECELGTEKAQRVVQQLRWVLEERHESI